MRKNDSSKQGLKVVFARLAAFMRQYGKNGAYCNVIDQEQVNRVPAYLVRQKGKPAKGISQKVTDVYAVRGCLLSYVQGCKSIYVVRAQVKRGVEEMQDKEKEGYEQDRPFDRQNGQKFDGIGHKVEFPFFDEWRE